MASDASDLSATVTVADAEDYLTAQEDNDSLIKIENEADDKDENEADNRFENEADNDFENEAKVRFLNEAEEDDEDEVDVSELTVFIPKCPTPHIAVIPHQTSFVRQAKARRRAMILEKEKSQLFKVLCGIIILLIMFGIGALMIVLALMFDIDDLFILGGIFICGGVLFTIGFIIARCTVVLPYAEAEVEEGFSVLKALHPGIERTHTPVFELTD